MEFTSSSACGSSLPSSSPTSWCQRPVVCPLRRSVFSPHAVIGNLITGTLIFLLHAVLAAHCPVTLCEAVLAAHCPVTLCEAVLSAHCPVTPCEAVLSAHCPVTLCEAVVSAHCPMTLCEAQQPLICLQGGVICKASQAAKCSIAPWHEILFVLMSACYNVL